MTIVSILTQQYGFQLICKIAEDELLVFLYAS